MTPRAFAVLAPRVRALSDDEVRRFERIARQHGLSPHRLEGGAAVAVAGAAAVGPNAVVVGHVFRREQGRPLDLTAVAARLGGNGDPDMAGAWGDFITIAASGRPAALAISRSPFGNVPCFWSEAGPHVVAASSPGFVEALAGRPPAIDWRALAIYLAAPELRTAWTCLEGLRELPGGSTLEVKSHSIAVAADWSPWQFAGGGRAIGDPEEASDLVGAAVDRAVAARCGQASGLVLLLSGGLDSSTVAAALARADSAFASLSMVTRQKAGDELVYARAVAAATGSPLTEMTRSTADLDWDDPGPRRLARPSARIFRQPTLGAACRLASDVGADTIVDGGGGDNVFCSLQSVTPLLDRLAVEGPGRGAWETAREIALRVNVGVGTVLVGAARRRLSGRIAFRWPTDTGFLGDGARALEGEATRHEWLKPPAGALPGQAAHVALVLGAIGLAEDNSTDAAVRTISPLVAQPVVEAALRVRSWLWFENGRDRAVIRRALPDRLPWAVVNRTGKGTPAGFMGDLVEDHRARLRELLLDGLLVAHGVADRAEIEAELASTALTPGNRFSRLLVIADAERWARLWM